MEITRRGFIKGAGLLGVILSIRAPFELLADTSLIEATDWVWVRKEDYWVCDQASETLLTTAVMQSTFMDFVSKVEKSPVLKTVTMEKLPKIGPSKTDITVSEFGRGISGIKGLPTKFNEEDIMQRAIIKQMQKSLDRLCALSLKSKAICLNMSEVGGDEQKWMAAENYISRLSRPFEDPWYIGITGTRFARGIKSSQKFKLWKDYLKEGDTLHLHEIGAIGNIRLVECNDTSCVRNEAVIFGEKPIGMIESDPLSLRAKDDTICWYGVIGVGVLNKILKIVGKQT